jgi:hypothetical protein
MIREVIPMKSIFLTILIAGLAAAGLATMAWGDNAAMEQIRAAQKLSSVTPLQDSLLRSVDRSDRTFTRLENSQLRIVSYFHQRKIGEAVVENDFIRYMFSTTDGGVIEETRKWRKDLPERLPAIVPKEVVEASAEGEIDYTRLLYISPDSEIYNIRPVPQNPCWVVRSTEGKRIIYTVFDAVTGAKLGYGTPPPYEGFSFYGPDRGACPQPPYAAWNNHAENARIWFEAMGYSTLKVGNATENTIRSQLQSDTTAMFFELNHGGSWAFDNYCDQDVTAGEVESWIGAYASMPFTFIASCDGMCQQGDNFFSHEFRKGADVDAVTVGYCGMSTPNCENNCWPNAVAWQNELFSRMNAGYRVWDAFGYANLAVPNCAAFNCMRIAGDVNMVFGGGTYPRVNRSRCGGIYDVYMPIINAYLSPFPPVTNTSYTRAPHIRCDSTVPAGQNLTVSATSSYPYNEVAFANGSRLKAVGTMSASPGSGSYVSLVSSADRGKGIILYGAGGLDLYNGGEVKIHE